MKSPLIPALTALTLTTTWLCAGAAELVPVTADNFPRAESDRYFAAIAAQKGIGNLKHNRELAPIDKQTVVRLNRDTLYSAGVFDLDAGPVGVTLPDAGGRFLSLQVINEDHYVPAVHYSPGTYQLTRESVGTRYVVLGIRVLANPKDPEDMRKAHALQDAIKVEQAAPGELKLPEWDSQSQSKVRQALLDLAAFEPDMNRAFGQRNEVEPIRHLIGTASAWGGNPQKDATYLNVTPKRNDGRSTYLLSVKDVPVDGFWSISVYNDKGYFVANPQAAYTINNVTADKSEDGSIKVQFGGCDDEKVKNCLPIMPGWNYMVRLYRPQPAILDGSWKFPQAQAIN